jgi:threonine/homoserine/homoserine lactone efflux protein
MMTAASWGFLLGWLGSMPIAGAVSVFVVQRGLAGRLRNGLAMAIGAALLEGAWCLLVLTGAGRLLERWPVTADIARIAGGVLVTGLGIYFLRRHTSLPIGGQGPVAPRRRLHEEFRTGLLLVGANPLVPLNWLALVTAAVPFGLDPGRHALQFAMGVTCGVIAWFAALLWLLSGVRHRLGARSLDRIMHVLGAILLLGGLFVLGRELLGGGVL